MRKNKTLSIKEAYMNTIADELVSIQTGLRACPLDALVVWRGLRIPDAEAEALGLSTLRS